MFMNTIFFTRSGARVRRTVAARRLLRGTALALSLAAMQPAPASPAAPAGSARDLAGLSLEQLGEVVVTSVSRRAEPLSSAPASIYVISAEEIRRSGATSLPQALRLAPNLQVARADAQQYAISARGGNNVLANKLLVLIDGRIVYSPLFSGVFWEVQDVALPDVDRIEVISGPGATLWGANAVNGVINVITRSAAATPGLLASAGLGSDERSALLRYGARAGDGVAWRIHAQTHDRRASRLVGGQRVDDAGDRSSAGLRVDWAAGEHSATLQGDIYNVDIDQRPIGRQSNGGHLLARWSLQPQGALQSTVQLYVDHNRREQPGFSESLDIADASVQQALPYRAHDVLQWGAGLRHARDRTRNGPQQGFTPGDRDLRWGHVYVQNERQLAQRWRLTAGLKLEHNDYTGDEWLPNLRLAWQPEQAGLWWGAVSRAVRAPSRLDREFNIPAAPPYAIAGGPDFESEVAYVAEVGYHSRPASRLQGSVTLFRHWFDRVRSYEPAVIGVRAANGLRGDLFGVEGWIGAVLGAGLRVDLGGLWQNLSFERRDDSRDTLGLATVGADPRAQAKLRLSYAPTDRHDAELMLRHVGRLRPNGAPAYTAVDLNLRWRPTPSLELAALVNNLLDDAHIEWGRAPNAAVFGREVFVRATWTP